MPDKLDGVCAIDLFAVCLVDIECAMHFPFILMRVHMLFYYMAGFLKVDNYTYKPFVHSKIFVLSCDKVTEKTWSQNQKWEKTRPPISKTYSRINCNYSNRK